MAWNMTDLTNAIITEKNFSKEISAKEDGELSAKITELRDNIKEIEKPFLYLAIGTANQSANNTNSSHGNYVTDDNILMQQYPITFLRNMEANHYTPVILNIDSFPEKARQEPDKYFNGVFPLSGKVTGEGNSQAIENIKNLFGEILLKNGKIFLLNAVQDLDHTTTNQMPYKFLMFKGIQTLLSFIPNAKRKDLVYASSYLQERNYFNLYRFCGKMSGDFKYLRNLEVFYEQLLYENVFPD